MSVGDRPRWLALARRLGCAHPAEAFEAVERAYSERHRHYHTMQHVRVCLSHLVDVRPLAERPDELELAIWLHDVVYRTRRSDNERRSADLAEAWLECADAPSVRIRRVRALILATRHDRPPETRDEALLQDIDLAILGAAEARYDAYEAEIRREYHWVPAPLFRRPRAALLERLLERQAVYRTAWFHERYEVAARANLRRAVRALLGKL